MAKDIRLENIQTQSAPRVDYGTDAIVRGIQVAGSAIGRGYESYKRTQQKELESQVASIRAEEQVEQKQIEAQEKQRLAEEAKAMEEAEARDRIRAVDELGKIQRDYFRKAQDLDSKWIGDKTSKEYEDEKKALFDESLEMAGTSLSPTVRKELNKQGKQWINALMLSDLQKAYKDEMKAAEDSAKNVASTAIDTGNQAGKLGDIEAGRANFAMTREALQDYADKTAEDSDTPMKRFDKQYMKSFISGVAETNPEMAEQLLKPETLAWFAQGDYEKEKSHYDNLSSELQKDLGKSIEYGKNLQKQQQETELSQNKILDAISFMDNPVILGANIPETATDPNVVKGLESIDPNYMKNEELRQKAREIHNASGMVGDGKISTLDIDDVVKKVASITLGENGEVDNNILKAFEADLSMRNGGASPEQLQTFHKVVQKALTDNDFKMQVAALANKPSFNDIIFKNGRSRDTGLRSWFTTIKDDDIAFVENIGKQAYFGAMDLMAQGKPDEALSYYDSKVEQAYDFIKRDIIDVDFVKKQLAKGQPAMVELNGNMTKIVGRLPNGEFIIEETGEKINGGF